MKDVPGASPKRILVLVPHPDDEAVGCAVALRRARAAGSAIFALYLTIGVPARAWPWWRGGYRDRVLRRREEALAAAAMLGIEPAGFLEPPARTLKHHLVETRAQIAAVLASHRIDTIWTPAFEGGHQDHDAANLLAACFAGQVPVIEFAEYNFAGGRTQSQRFIAPTDGAPSIVLTPGEAAYKRAVLALYRSERRNLAHVDCAVESLRPLASYDYGRPPHDGRLFYARFQWVPFRHPRIDFDPPAAVYGALGRFALEAGLDRAGSVAVRAKRLSAAAVR